MGRRKINKHLLHNQTANSLAYRAIKIGGSIKQDSILYAYDEATNTLTIDDGIVKEIYKPLINNEVIDPFYKQVLITYGGETNE